MNQRKLTCIDLFCGCGGFTLGMQRAGFRVLATVDSDINAVATLRSNLVEKRNFGFTPVLHALQRDLTKFEPSELASLLDVSNVDVIVGGPPCQGFSMARQVDGANHGVRLTPDSRRYLYRDFFRFVDFFQPYVFVIENVLGIHTAGDGEYFTCVQKEARELGRAVGRPGYRVHSQIEDAWVLGVPQKRRRRLIIGVRNDLPGYFLPDFKPAPRAKLGVCLGAAIGDLPILRADSGVDERDYDFKYRAKHFRKWGNTARSYLYRTLEVKRSSKISNHVSRPHMDRDLRDFARLKEGENSAVAIRDRSVIFEFPYKKHHFKDRYTRQSRWQPCSTIVAHLSKDGLMFIHPTQNRSLTPREVARVQSFPDWFTFPTAPTHSFRLIGNAVPPLVAEAVGIAIKRFLRKERRHVTIINDTKREIEDHNSAVRDLTISCDIRSQEDALYALAPYVQLDRRALRALPLYQFQLCWKALLFLYPDLHPVNALDHGQTVETLQTVHFALPGYVELLSHRYVRSGWPVALENIGRVAWRRYKAGDLSIKEFYCADVHRARLSSGVDHKDCRLIDNKTDI